MFRSPYLFIRLSTTSAGFQSTLREPNSARRLSSPGWFEDVSRVFQGQRRNDGLLATKRVVSDEDEDARSTSSCPSTKTDDEGKGLARAILNEARGRNPGAAIPLYAQLAATGGWTPSRALAMAMVRAIAALETVKAPVPEAVKEHVMHHIVQHGWWPRDGALNVLVRFLAERQDWAHVKAATQHAQAAQLEPDSLEPVLRALGHSLSASRAVTLLTEYSLVSPNAPPTPSVLDAFLRQAVHKKSRETVRTFWEGIRDLWVWNSTHLAVVGRSLGDAKLLDQALVLLDIAPDDPHLTIALLRACVSARVSARDASLRLWQIEAAQVERRPLDKLLRESVAFLCDVRASLGWQEAEAAAD